MSNEAPLPRRRRDTCAGRVSAQSRFLPCDLSDVKQRRRPNLTQDGDVCTRGDGENPAGDECEDRWGQKGDAGPARWSATKRFDPQGQNRSVRLPVANGSNASLQMMMNALNVAAARTTAPPPPPRHTWTPPIPEGPQKHSPSIKV